ncbi:MAG: glycosyltransferase family 1 protein [Candidatus Abyssobacteria bacterium SURF_5]|uniref:Glycosyltransferase family 1 protein n=1 Tax=Abyssobacteria bacterium (strain SURF_5) TaxID=2093360 RepID=A0A3A4NYN1_ABYX5|nr:MAG: glycosyltransferase family 1 protein [Candidatus Abyssubacteria bacterium SURF_5]
MDEPISFSGAADGFADSTRQESSASHRQPSGHVCHIISGDLWAGAACQAYHLLSDLIKTETMLFSAITFNPGKLTNQLTSIGMPVLCLPEDRLSSLEILSEIHRYVDNHGIDIIHCHGHKEQIFGCIASLLLRKRVKVVRTLHGMPEPYSGLAGVRAKCYQILQNCCSLFLTEKIVVVSNDMKDRLKQRKWARKLICIHNGIDPEKVKPTVSREQMKNLLGIVGDDYVIGVACRLVPIKRLDILLQTMRFLQQKHKEVLLLIAGDGPLLSQLKRQAQLLGIEKRVRFLGFRTDIYDVMSTFDVFVMTSDHEGVPMGLLEAVALGIRVVAPAVGGIPEVVNDHTAVLLENLNCETLADCLHSEILKHRAGEKGHLTQKHLPPSSGETSLKMVQLYENIGISRKRK